MSAAARWSEAPCIAAAALAGAAPIVVLAPHPDDESLGCGALLAAAFAGKGARVICLTDGSGSHPGSRAWPPARLARKRREELCAAVRRLGGCDDDVTWLDHPDQRLDTLDPQPIAARIARICRHLGARRLFATSPLDPHSDHKATARIAGLVGRSCPDLQLFHYPIWSRWNDPKVEDAGAGRMLRLASLPYRAAKAAAIAAHESQQGGVVADDPDGFALDPAMVQLFTLQDEIYFEVAPCG